MISLPSVRFAVTAWNVGYFFMITGESSTARVFASGGNTAISGVTVGVYLFRNTRLP